LENRAEQPESNGKGSVMDKKLEAELEHNAKATLTTYVLANGATKLAMAIMSCPVDCIARNEAQALKNACFRYLSRMSGQSVRNTEIELKNLIADQVEALRVAIAEEREGETMQ
jgi:hypothetical protein